MKTLPALIVGLLGFAVSSPVHGDEARFFPNKGMEFGVYYYPEHWPEGQWERDIKRVAELGFDFIHYAEFAWARLEPEDGRFDFAWLDRAVDLADQSGLKVVMCTPSPCIPAWLATKHPEVLAMDRDGRRLHHDGGRLNGSLANPIYRQYVARIAGRMAERYGNDPRIIGWQIGNEPHIQCEEDYSPSAQAEFVAWLRKKYGTIEEVNAAWGAAFWRYTLNDFSQIKMPGANPHARLDFKTYTSEEIARDLIDQARILRGHNGGKQWITTNYTYYQNLKRMAVDVEVVTETADFDPRRIPFLVVPAMQMMGLEVVRKLEDYAARGGHLILTTRTALKDPRGHLWEAKIQQPIWNLIGGEVEFYDHLPKDRPGVIRYDGKPHRWHVWGTVVKPSDGTESWGVYEDQFYQGRSAVLHRKTGPGSVTYVGAWSDNWDMEYQILRRVYGGVLGSLPFDLPPYVFAHYREGLWTVVNYTDQQAAIPVPDSAEVIHGSRTLPPAGVLVWQEAEEQ